MSRYVMLILGTVAVLLFACSSTNRSATRRNDLGGEWVLQSIAGEKDPDKIFSESRMPALLFDASKMSVSGNNGCNRISGKYTLPGKEKIKFGPLMSTKMACPDIGDGESIFMNAISKSNSFTIDGTNLILKDGNTEVMRFVKQIKDKN